MFIGIAGKRSRVRRGPLPVVSAGFAVDGAAFDGSTYLTRGASYTGAADSRSLLMSFWYRTASWAGNTVLFDNTGDLVAFSSFGGTFSIYANDAVGTSKLQIDQHTGVPLPADANWHHVMVAMNTNAAAGLKTAQMYVDDVALTVDVTDAQAAFDIDFTQGNWSIAAYVDSQFAFVGDLAEFYIAPGQFLDLSVQANRRKFRDGAGKPVSLGATGSTPTGIAPAFFHHLDDGEAPANFGINRGSGGGMTVTGTITTSPTNP